MRALQSAICIHGHGHGHGLGSSRGTRARPQHLHQNDGCVGVTVTCTGDTRARRSQASPRGTASTGRERARPVHLTAPMHVWCRSPPLLSWLLVSIVCVCRDTACPSWLIWQWYRFRLRLRHPSRLHAHCPSNARFLSSVAVVGTTH